MTARNITPIREQAQDVPPTTIDELVEARMAGLVGSLVNDDLISTIVDETCKRIVEDPYAIYANRYELYSVREIAEIVQMHPETVAEWTRRPDTDPDHLPVVRRHPIRVLPADFVDWMQRNRSQ